MSLHWVEKLSITHQLSHFYKHTVSESYKASPIHIKWSWIEPKKNQKPTQHNTNPTHLLSITNKHYIAYTSRGTPISLSLSLSLSFCEIRENQHQQQRNQNPQNKQGEKRVLRDENGGRRDCEAWNPGGTEQHQHCSKPKPENCGGRRRG